MNVGHLVPLFGQLKVGVAAYGVNLAAHGQEEGMGVASGHLDHLEVKSDAARLVEKVGAVGLLDAELADMVITTGSHFATLRQHEGLVAAARDTHYVLGSG